MIVGMIHDDNYSCIENTPGRRVLLPIFTRFADALQYHIVMMYFIVLCAYVFMYLYGELSFIM